MGKGRLEAFSDGVIAILITIMVLEMKVPEGAGVEALRPVMPVFLSYVLSFIYLGIYWTNHHHLLHTVRRVSGGILWANLHLLFWLSLVPLATSWLGEYHDTSTAAAAYGVVMLLAAIGYYILQLAIMAEQGPDSVLRRAVGADWKGKLSPLIYATAIALAYWRPSAAIALYVLVALIWLIPDRRIERVLREYES